MGIRPIGQGGSIAPPGIVRVLKPFRVKTLDLPPVLQWPPRPPPQQPWSFFSKPAAGLGVGTALSLFRLHMHPSLPPHPRPEHQIGSAAQASA